MPSWRKSKKYNISWKVYVPLCDHRMTSTWCHQRKSRIPHGFRMSRFPYEPLFTRHMVTCWMYALSVLWGLIVKKCIYIYVCQKKKNINIKKLFYNKKLVRQNNVKFCTCWKVIYPPNWYIKQEASTPHAYFLHLHQS